MANESVGYRPAAQGERIPNHRHYDLVFFSLVSFGLAIMASLVILSVAVRMNLRADRDRDVISVAAVKYPEFTLSDCPAQEALQRKELQAKIEQLQKALDEMGR